MEGLDTLRQAKPPRVVLVSEVWSHSCERLRPASEQAPLPINSIGRKLFFCFGRTTPSPRPCPSGLLYPTREMQVLCSQTAR